MVQALTAGSVLPIPLGDPLAGERIGAPTSDSALFDLALLAPRLVSVETEGDGTASPAIDSTAITAGDRSVSGADPVDIPTGEAQTINAAPPSQDPRPIAAGLLPPSNPDDDAALAQALSALAALEQAGRSTLSPRPAPSNLIANPIMAQFGRVLTMPKAESAASQGMFAAGNKAPEDIDLGTMPDPTIKTTETTEPYATTSPLPEGIVPGDPASPAAPASATPLAPLSVHQEPAQFASEHVTPSVVTPSQEEPRDARSDAAQDGSAPAQRAPATDASGLDVSPFELSALEVASLQVPVLDADSRASTATRAQTLSLLDIDQPSLVVSPHAIEDARRSEQAIKIGDLVNEPRPIILPNRPMPVAPPLPLTDPVSSIPDHAVLEMLTDDVAPLDALSFGAKSIAKPLDTSAATSIIERKIVDEDDAVEILLRTAAVDALSDSSSIQTNSDDQKDDHSIVVAQGSSSDLKDLMNDTAMLFAAPDRVAAQIQVSHQVKSSDKSDDDADNQTDARQSDADLVINQSAQEQALMMNVVPVMPSLADHKIDHDDWTDAQYESGRTKRGTSLADAFTIKAEQMINTADHQDRLDASQAPQAANLDLKTLMARADKMALPPDLDTDGVLSEAVKTALAPLLKEQASAKTESTQSEDLSSGRTAAHTLFDAIRDDRSDASDHEPSQQNGRSFSDSSSESYSARHASDLTKAIKIETREFEITARAEQDSDAHEVSREDASSAADATLSALSTQVNIESLAARDATLPSNTMIHATQIAGEAITGGVTPSLAVFTAPAVPDLGSAQAPQATQQLAQTSYARVDNPVFEMQRDRAFETQIIAALKAGRNDVRVSLYPPQLGQVTINLALDGQKVKVSLKTSNREATSVLSAERNTLAFALDHEGFTLEDFDVADDASGQDKNNHHQESVAGVAPTSTSSSEFSIDITI